VTVSKTHESTPAFKIVQLWKVTVPGSSVLQAESWHASLTTIPVASPFVGNIVAGTAAVPSPPVFDDVFVNRTVEV